MNKSWTDDAWEDFEYWIEHDKKTHPTGCVFCI